MYLSLLALTLLTFEAQSSETETYVLPEVASYADRFLRENHSETVIPSEEIAHSHARTVGDLIRRVPGVDFGANFSGSAYSYIRGGSSSQTLVLVDGVKMNDPSSSTRAFDFTNIDLNQVESIKILKGPQSVSYGSDASSGVILIQTKNSNIRDTLHFRQEAGSRHSHRTGLTGSKSLNQKASLQLSLSQDTTQGISAAAVANGDRDGSQAKSGTLDFEYTPSDRLHIDLRTGIDYTRQEIDAAALSDDPNYISRTRILRDSVHTDYQLSEQTSILFDLSHLDTRRAYSNPADSLNPSPFDAIYRGKNDSLATGLKLKPSDKWELATGADFQRETFSLSSNTLTPGAQSAQSRSVGLFAQAKNRLGDSTLIEFGVRHDRPEGIASNTSYRVGLEEKLSPEWVAFTRTGAGFKAPSLSSRFDPQFGNRSLRSEKSRTYEGGLTFTPNPKLDFTFSGFLTRYKDLIGYDPRTFISQNTSDAEVRGFEFSSSYSFLYARLLPHLTYLDARDRTRNAELPRRARWKTGAILQLDFTDRIQTEIETLIKSSRLDSAGSTARAPGYMIWNLAITYKFHSNIQAFLRGENVLDRTYQEDRGFFTPGRGLFGGVQIEI